MRVRGRSTPSRCSCNRTLGRRVSTALSSVIERLSISAPAAPATRTPRAWWTSLHYITLSRFDAGGEADMALEALRSRVARFFELEAHGSSVRQEALGGVTTFLAMSYIVFVNPGVLSQAGMDFRAVMYATCLAAALSTF